MNLEPWKTGDEHNINVAVHNINVVPLPRLCTAFQKALFERILRETGGNHAEAARRLGYHPNSFRRRCSELGTDPEFGRLLKQRVALAYRRR
jgi:DNA-binding NtrC family response regulator